MRPLRQPRVSIVASFLRLFSHVQPRRRRQIALLCLLMLAGAAAELVTLGAVVPLLSMLAAPDRAMEHEAVRWLAELLAVRRPSELLLPITFAFIALAIVSAMMRLVLLWRSAALAQRLGSDFGVEVYRRTLYQPYRFHVARNSSEIIAAVNKVQAVLSDVLTPTLQGLISLVLSAAILVGLFVIDATLAIAAGVGIGSAYAVARGLSRRRLRHNSAILAQTYSRRVQAVQEGLGGIRDILLDGSQSLHIERFRRLNEAHLGAHLSTTVVATAPRYFIEALGVSVIALLAYSMAVRGDGLIAALPVLGALALGAQRLIPLLQQVYQAASQVAGNHQIIDDVVAMLEQPVAPELLIPGSRSRLALNREIEMRDVRFQYQEQGPFVLQGIDLRIPRGARVGLIGRTGSGKSTLLDVLMGLLEPTHGELLIDGVRLSAQNRRDWQARISHVPQHIYLADATVAENIAFGVDSRSFDFERVRSAACLAQIADFIESAPGGYDMLVGERGVRLSGGQRQRIGIARALYRDADVLVLDEATSALDDITEAAVMSSIETHLPHVTVVIIAHRISILRACDMIVSIDQGRIVRVGASGSELTGVAPQSAS